MGVMRKTLLLAAFAASCTPRAADAPPAPDEPLSSYDSVFGGVPSNDSLPTDVKADAIYPRSFTELLSTQSPVRNQSHRGICTIFSTTALMEHLYIKAGMPMPDFSEQYLQWSTKVELGEFADSEASSNQSNLRAIAHFGIVEESLYP